MANLDSFKNFRAEVWESRLEYWIGKILAFGGIVNTKYDGVIKNWGDVVRVNIIGDVSVKNYVPREDIEVERLDSSQTTVEIDQGKYWSFITDDIERVSLDKAAIDDAMRSASYNLNDAIDQYIAGFYTGAGITYGVDADPIILKVDTVKKFFARMNRTFEEARLPTQGRWMFVTPWMREKLVLAQILDNTDNSTFLENGIVGSYMGWQLRLSSNIPKVGDNDKILAGVGNNAITFAQGFTKTAVFEPDLRFEQGIKGLSLYGAKILRPDMLCCATVQEFEE
jgi:hypothetical protein